MINDITDFLPKYPDINDANFNLDIYSKKEFNDDKLSKYEKPPKEPGILLKAQKIISRFLSSYTPYNELLVARQMGVGKTAAAIGTVENILKMENSNFKGAIIFAKGDTLLDNFKEAIMFEATKGEYIPENYEDLTSKEKTHRKNKLLGKSYSFYTFEKFAKNIDKLRDETIVNDYSNRIIVIDEVHNIRLQDKKNKKKTKLIIYNNFHRFLHLVKNCKILLLSGTPMKDTIGEIASVMNLILPLNQQLPPDKIFMNDFFDKDGLFYNIKPDKLEILKKVFKGRVSYLESTQSEVIKEFEGEVLGELKHFKVYADFMGEFQSEAYEKAYQKDTKKKDKDVEEDEEEEEEEEEDVEIDNGAYDGATLFDNDDDDDKIGRFSKNMRQASLFVFPNGTYGKKGFSPESGYINKKSNRTFDTNKKYSVFELTKKLKDLLKGNSQDNMLEKLEKYSSKYAAAIRNIIDGYNKGESSFVYCEFVEGSGGILFSLILNLFGFKQYSGKESLDKDTPPLVPAKRYAIINNVTADPNQVRNIIKRFNEPTNMHGKNICVIIGSRVISEGISLYNIQREHILTPHWNYSETAQAIGRGYRFGSHEQLIKAGIKPVLKVYQYVSICNKPDIPSIDLKLYEKSEIKDINIKKIERIMKESAFDCALAYERNYIPGYDNQRECNYTNCDYKCDDIDLDKPVEIDVSSYQVYYNNNNVEDIINLLKTTLFRYEFKSDINTIFNLLNHYSQFDILTALRKLINENMVIHNKYGIDSYLREDKNVYFLSPTISSQNNIFSNYYDIKPILTFRKNYTEIIDEIYYNNLPILMDKLFKSVDQTEMQDIIEGFNNETKEMLIELCIDASTRKLKNNVDQREFIINYFSYAIETINDVIISTLLFKEKNILRCYTDKGGWAECDENMMEEYIESKKQKKIELKQNKFFGLYSGSDIEKFCIVKSNFAEDNRNINAGRVCWNAWPKAVLFHLIINDLKIPTELIKSPDLFIRTKWNNVLKESKKGSEHLIDKIINDKNVKYCTYDEESKKWEENDYTYEDIQDTPIEELEKILYIAKIGRKEQCKIIREYFKQNGILTYDESCANSNKQKI